MGIDNPISFMDLPPELRIQIYKLLVEGKSFLPYRPWTNRT
jgi:hypothetical protein